MKKNNEQAANNKKKPQGIKKREPIRFFRTGRKRAGGVYDCYWRKRERQQQQPGGGLPAGRIYRISGRGAYARRA